MDHIKLNRGIVNFKLDILFPEGKWRDLISRHGVYRFFLQYSFGFNVLYCKKSEEIALEIVRQKNVDDKRQVDAALLLKRNLSINISYYLKQIKAHPNTSSSEYRIVDNFYFIIKLNPTNTYTAFMKEFEKIQTKRNRKESEVFIAPDGRVGLPKFMSGRIDVNQNGNTIAFTPNENGVRMIKPDSTVNIKTLLKPFPVTQNTYIQYRRVGEGIEIDLDEEDSLIRKEKIRMIKRALGIDD